MATIGNFTLFILWIISALIIFSFSLMALATLLWATKKDSQGFFWLSFVMLACVLYQGAYFEHYVSFPKHLEFLFHFEWIILLFGSLNGFYFFFLHYHAIPQITIDGKEIC